MTTSVQVRPALISDSVTVGALLMEGFGHEYGGAPLRGAVQRMMTRVYALPGRLRGVFVAATPEGEVVGMAGMQTTELRPGNSWPEEQIMLEELGMINAVWYELRADLVEPTPYRPRYDEAFIYSVVVTAHWRGQGVGDALLAAIQGEARRRGKRRVVLQVVADNRAAIRLYERNGYTVLKRRRGPLSFLRLGVPPRLLMGLPLDQR